MNKSTENIAFRIDVDKGAVFRKLAHEKSPEQGREIKWTTLLREAIDDILARRDVNTGRE